MIQRPEYEEVEDGLRVFFPHDSVADRLVCKADQLESLLSLMKGTGDVGAGMFTFADEIQHTLLWLASDLSEEIMQLAWSNATAFRISPSENASEASTLAIAAQVAATRPRSKKTGSAEVSESEHA